MRIIFHNPHTLWYKLTLGNFIDKRKAVDKYEYLFDYVYRKQEKVFVYLEPIVRGKYARHLITTKFHIWVLINQLKPSRFEIVQDIEKLNEDDILLSFVYENFTNLNGRFDIPREPLIRKFRNTKAFKVINLSHYGYNAALGSKNAKAAEIDLFTSENNLSKNGAFFQHYYSWYHRDVYVLPFVPQKRFVRTTGFEGRKNKAIAMGTITFPMVDHDFVGFFKDDKLQPMRHEIYNNAGRLIDYIDSYISHISTKEPLRNNNTEGIDVHSGKRPRAPAYKYIKTFKRLIQVLMAALRLMIAVIIRRKPTSSVGGKERQYFKFDIVRKYNEYRMFVCPEEIIDVPGIGFAEGMACGCAYVGKRDPMYSDLGLVDKTHYIGYDGTIEDLKDNIEYYQNNPIELEAIAEKGWKFITEKMNDDVVCTRFFTDIADMCLEK